MRRALRCIAAAVLSAVVMVGAVGCKGKQESSVQADVQITYGDEGCLSLEAMLLAHINDGAALDKTALAEVTELSLYGNGIISVVCGDVGGTDIENEHELWTTSNPNHFAARIGAYYTGSMDGSLSQYYEDGISDLSFAAEMEELAELKVVYNNISDVSVLAGLKKLKSLDISLNPLTDLSSVIKCTQLTSLNLEGCWIEDHSLLAEMTGLRELNLRYTGMAEDALSYISGLTELVSLSLSGTHISLEPLAALKKLERLDLSDTMIVEQDSFEAVKGIKWLNMSDLTFISDYRGISVLTELEYLDLSLNDMVVFDLSPLSNMKNLKYLSLSEDYSISDISALSGLSSLEELYAPWCSIEDVTPLMELDKLRSVNLGGCSVKDPTPLKELKQLEFLHLGLNEIDESALAALREALPECDIRA
ncbi:MAG: hypothetical protein E7478_08150 [Ruminococcaceae bacterium]|nr:hypothetical protein [Oscillospiraceae bacterium]